MKFFKRYNQHVNETVLQDIISWFEVFKNSTEKTKDVPEPDIDIDSPLSIDNVKSYIDLSNALEKYSKIKWIKKETDTRVSFYITTPQEIIDDYNYFWKTLNSTPSKIGHGKPIVHRQTNIFTLVFNKEKKNITRKNTIITIPRGRLVNFGNSLSKILEDIGDTKKMFNLTKGEANSFKLKMIPVKPVSMLNKTEINSIGKYINQDKKPIDFKYIVSCLDNAVNSYIDVQTKKNKEEVLKYYNIFSNDPKYSDDANYFRQKYPNILK